MPEKNALVDAMPLTADEMAVLEKVRRAKDLRHADVFIRIHAGSVAFITTTEKFKVDAKGNVPLT